MQRILLSLVFSVVLVAIASAQDRPNIVVVFIDDMGWADFSCFGNTEASTPNIDALAEEGIRFHQFYVNSPICSPSRVALSTGQYPARHRITSYLNNRQSNRQRGVANWLSPDAPMLARFLQDAGYATAHCGKWHMGGQRDVDNAPPITQYGFDESLTNFEGMGAKLLPMTERPGPDGEIIEGRIWENAVRLGEPVTWMLRSEITGGFTDAAIEFLNESQSDQQPFYINVWPDDVHSPHFPTVDRWSDSSRKLYLAVLEQMDQQFGRLFDRIKTDPKLRDNTLIIICSDNGPELSMGSSAPMRGIKATLFEGGIRSPLVVWGPGIVAESAMGTINRESVFSAMDLVPSLLKIADVPIPADANFDGEDLSQTLTGRSNESRQQPLFFRRPPDRKEFRDLTALPDLAVRDGKWKLLCDYDGSRQLLYDLSTDISESVNVADQNPGVSERLTAAVLTWNATMPKDAGDPQYRKSVPQ